MLLTFNSVADTLPTDVATNTIPRMNSMAPIINIGQKINFMIFHFLVVNSTRSTFFTSTDGGVDLIGKPHFGQLGA